MMKPKTVKTKSKNFGSNEDDLRARMVISEENEPLKQNADSLILPVDSDCTCNQTSPMESSGVMPSEHHLEVVYKSQESMKHTIKITKPESVWIVEIEPDVVAEGIIATTFNTTSSLDLIGYSEVYSFTIESWECMISQDFSRIKGKDGLIECHLEVPENREETETERRVREILCRLFKIEI